MEKRNSDRHITDQSILCTFFTSQSSNNTIEGKIKNYCDFGMFAILPTQVREGTVLFVRTTSNDPERLPAKIEEGFRSVSLVEVKWSKPLSVHGAVWYGTGLKHLSILWP
jgi:hypothetical protein